MQWQVEEGRPDAVPLPTIGGPAVTGFCSLTEAGSLLFVDLLELARHRARRHRRRH